MKSIYLFSTKPWVYLTEIPVIILFWLAVHFNSYSEQTFKFYPLIIVCALAIVFIAVYFFRYISINNDEIRSHGVFSSKDNALIAENKTLVITILPRLNTKIELYADAGEEPAFEWMKATDVIHRDICIFRGRVFGGKSSAKKILNFFTLTKEESDSVMQDNFSFENDVVKVTSNTENEAFKVTIKFKITII